MAQRRNHLASSGVLLYYKLYCSKWLLFEAGRVFPKGMFDRWRSKNKPQSRASVDPRVTFVPDRPRLALRNCHSIQRTRHQSNGDNRAYPPSSHTFDRQAERIISIIYCTIFSYHVSHSPKINIIIFFNSRGETTLDGLKIRFFLVA